jgi:hypothetical protein
MSFSPRLFFIAGLALCASLVPARATCFPASLPLSRGDFSFFHFFFKPTDTLKTPKALVLFGSGGAGWGGWEDRVGDKLQAEGYEVLGINSEIYAHSDYDINNLQADFQKMAQAYRAPYGAHPPPVILGGWSTGAEQAVAVAGGPHPPDGLVGLLLVSPGSSGAYGRDATDYVLANVPPQKVFQLVGFAPRLVNLRIAQWHAQYDLLDSLTWLSFLKTGHREYDFSNSIHDFRSACDEFLTRLSGSVAWITDGDNEPAGITQWAPAE